MIAQTPMLSLLVFIVVLCMYCEESPTQLVRWNGKRAFVLGSPKRSSSEQTLRIIVKNSTRRCQPLTSRRFVLRSCQTTTVLVLSETLVLVARDSTSNLVAFFSWIRYIRKLMETHINVS